MSKAKIVTDSDGRFYGIRINCPGCASIRAHGNGEVVMPIRDWCPDGMEPSTEVGSRARWTFNGDFDRPVFGPSLLSRQTMHEPPVTPENIEQWRASPWEQHPVDHVCHSFIGCNGAQPGQIFYLNDCTHSLAGQTVELPEITE